MQGEAQAQADGPSAVPRGAHPGVPGAAERTARCAKRADHGPVSDPGPGVVPFGGRGAAPEAFDWVLRTGLSVFPPPAPELSAEAWEVVLATPQLPPRLCCRHPRALPQPLCRAGRLGQAVTRWSFSSARGAHSRRFHHSRMLHALLSKSETAFASSSSGHPPAWRHSSPSPLPPDSGAQPAGSWGATPAPQRLKPSEACLRRGWGRDPKQDRSLGPLCRPAGSSPPAARCSEKGLHFLAVAVPRSKIWRDCKRLFQADGFRAGKSPCSARPKAPALCVLLILLLFNCNLNV